MSMEAGFDSHSEFWALVGTLEPSPHDLAEQRMQVANDPIVRLGLSWLHENPHLDRADFDEYRERLVQATASQFCLAACEVDRAFYICEAMMENEKSPHGKA